MQEILTLNTKEQKRLMVFNQIETKSLSVKEGATLLDLSQRQIWRILAAYRKEGAAALAHGNRGRKPSNATEDSLKLKVVELAQSTYRGFNYQHLTEELAEEEGIHLCRATVRNILLEAGICSPRRRRPPRHRSRRPRYPQEGMLLQTDGSPHDWLEGRGPKLCLIGAIDDATGTVPYAFFQEQEDTRGYMLMLKEIALTKGLPLALYHDKHSIFKVNEDKEPTLEEQLEGKEPHTQMGRLLNELGITSISANSPQAKGRIERLWGTFQDRLTSKLRQAGARTLEEANQVLAVYLPKYNRRFGVKASEPEIAYRKLEQGFQAEEHFCFKYSRTVGKDNVVRFKTARLQVWPTPERISYARCQVEVQERLDGSLAVYYQGRPLPTRPAPLESSGLRQPCLPEEVATPSGSARRLAKPSPDHPWRGIWRKPLPRVET